MDFLVHHLLASSAVRRPRQEALVHGTRRWSYGELSRRVNSAAAKLRLWGIRRGDRVGVYLAPSIEQVVAVLAVSRAGGVFVPIHHKLMARQVAHIVRDSGMTALIVDGNRLSDIEPVLRGASVDVVVPVGRRGQVPGPWQSYPFEEACADLSTEQTVDECVDQDLAAIVYTSGSTGAPKGVMLSHANILAGARIVADYLDISDQDRTLAVLPFSFDAGLNQLMTTIHAGGTLVIGDFVFTREVVSLLLEERITALAGVPTLWNMLVDRRSGFADHRFPNLRYVTNTGGALPSGTIAALRKTLPTTQVILMYGLTEAFRSTYLPFEELDRRPTSIGKAIPNTEIMVIAPDGCECGPGEVGELVHSGPTVAMGYWGEPESSARVWRPHPRLPCGLRERNTVCYSGDLVKRDDEGFLYFVGRRDNVIKSAGFRISPTEVEDVIREYNGVNLVAVVGTPHDTLGEEIVAFVTVENGAAPETDALLEFCAAHLPRHMVPRLVETVEALPLTTSGKVDYPALRQWARGRARMGQS